MKTWLYLPFLLLGFLFVGCTKTTNEVVIPNQTISYDVASSAWEQVGSTFVVDFDIPPLNSNTNQSDGVIVSMARYNNSGVLSSTFEMLPEVYENQAYSVLHNNGRVSIEVKGVNGAPTLRPPGKVRFKVVIIPSERV
ncbi:hypothetical protein [Chitinophaga nivalis]|uniref:DUF1735 domain-containing protein n=1 Tax=Chitinophaga nivalis TaxID=2991709 RepID=A0ABT3IG76_9BACT|nr:hypothetical protein [Chitinophaga nivalis]MCW3467349.1 hypothetical protein [Chitinophaga nivalis]MCW3482959.1 hypothetical protein [Chitinophaga nivalis]